MSYGLGLRHRDRFSVRVIKRIGVRVRVKVMVHKLMLSSVVKILSALISRCPVEM